MLCNTVGELRKALEKFDDSCFILATTEENREDKPLGITAVEHDGGTPIAWLLLDPITLNDDGSF